MRRAIAVMLIVSAPLFTIVHAQNRRPSTTRPYAVGKERDQNLDAIDRYRRAWGSLDRVVPEITLEAEKLGNVIDTLNDTSAAPITIRWEAMEAAGIGRSTPVTSRMKNVKCSKALRVILDHVAKDKAEVAWVIDDGVITISTRADLRAASRTRTFDVGRLFDRQPPRGPPTAEEFRDARGTEGFWELRVAREESELGPGETRNRREGALLSIITTAVDPTSWKTRTGGSFDPPQIKGDEFDRHAEPREPRHDREPPVGALAVQMTALGPPGEAPVGQRSYNVCSHPPSSSGSRPLSLCSQTPFSSVTVPTRFTRNVVRGLAVKSNS